jgi:hypothetical protein
MTKLVLYNDQHALNSQFNNFSLEMQFVIALFSE